ncbi:hypothetical protein FOZ62_015220, partial [Perkinsus olseni]
MKGLVNELSNGDLSVYVTMLPRKGTAIVKVKTDAEAERAIQLLNGKRIGGRVLLAKHDKSMKQLGGHGLHRGLVTVGGTSDTGDYLLFSGDEATPHGGGPETGDVAVHSAERSELPTTRRVRPGVVKVPWIDDRRPKQNYDAIRARDLRITQRLARRPEELRAYEAAVDELLKSGAVEELPPGEDPRRWARHYMGGVPVFANRKST